MILYAILILAFGFVFGGLTINAIWAYHFKKWEVQGILKWKQYNEES